MVQTAAVLIVSQAKLEQALGAVQASQAELASEKKIILDLQRQHNQVHSSPSIPPAQVHLLWQKHVATILVGAHMRVGHR